LILAALRSAAAFLGIAWRRAWLAMLLAAAASAAALATRGRPDGGLWLAAVAVAVIVASGALWRLGLERAGTGPGGLQAGRVELRLIAVTGLSVVFLMVLATLAFVVLLAFAYAAAASGRGFVASDIATWAPAVDSRGQVVVTAVAGLCALGLAWASARISLAAPATIVRDRVQVLATWPITRGQAWRLLGANLIVTAVPALAIAGLLQTSASRASLALPAQAAAGLVFAGLWLPLVIGLMTWFYRRLDADGKPRAAA
jgi:hypothetical protein